MKQEIFTIKKIESLSPLSQILSHVLIYSWSLSRENCRVFKLIWFGEVLLQFLNHFCGSLVLIEAIDFKNTQKGSQQCNSNTRRESDLHTVAKEAQKKRLQQDELRLFSGLSLQLLQLLHNCEDHCHFYSLSAVHIIHDIYHIHIILVYN